MDDSCTVLMSRRLLSTQHPVYCEHDERSHSRCEFQKGIRRLLAYVFAKEQHGALWGRPIPHNTQNSFNVVSLVRMATS